MGYELVPAYTHKAEVKEIFTEYTDMLIAGDSKFSEYLVIQNYDDELEHLEHKYGMPEGRLYLLYDDGQLAGSVGMRKIDRENCELKRLYVRPAFRGKGYGEMLTNRILADAREAGYRYMLLDTLPFLKTAIAMYERMGFYRVEQYNDSPIETTIYMKFDL